METKEHPHEPGYAGLLLNGRWLSLPLYSWEFYARDSAPVEKEKPTLPAQVGGGAPGGAAAPAMVSPWGEEQKASK